MKQHEIVKILEDSAVIISHKRTGAYNAINHVVYIAEKIVNGLPIPEDNQIPDVWFDKLKTSGISADDIKLFRSRRGAAWRYIDDTIVMLLEKHHLGVESLEFEFLFMDLPYKHYLTEQQIIAFQENVLSIDLEMAAARYRLSAILEVLHHTTYNKPRAAVDFINAIPHRKLEGLSLEFQNYFNTMANIAGLQVQRNATIDLDSVINHIEFIAPAHGLDRQWVTMLLTPHGKNIIADAMLNKPKVRYPTHLELFVKNAYVEWLNCRIDMYCRFDILNTSFAGLFKPAIEHYVHPELADYGRKRAVERLPHFIVPANPAHPVHIIYNLTDSLIAIYPAQNNNKTLSIQAACMEMLNTNYSISASAREYLPFVCEKERVKYATELQSAGNPVHTALFLTGKIRLREAKELASIFSGRLDYSYVTAGFGMTFERLSAKDLQRVMYPVEKYQIGINTALELFHTDSVADEQLLHYQTVVNTLKPCNPALMTQTYRDNTSFVGNITNEVLLTSFASLLTACMELRVSKQQALTRGEINNDEDQQNALWFFGLAMLCMGATFLMCLQFKPKEKSKPTLTLAIDRTLFGLGKREEKGTRAELIKLMPSHGRMTLR